MCTGKRLYLLHDVCMRHLAHPRSRANGTAMGEYILKKSWASLDGTKDNNHAYIISLAFQQSQFAIIYIRFQQDYIIYKSLLVCCRQIIDIKITENQIPYIIMCLLSY